MSARLTLPRPAHLPRTGGALRLYGLPLNPQATHITPRAGAAAQPPIFIKALALPVILVVAVRQIAELKLVLDVVVVHQAGTLAARAPPHAAAVALHVQFLAPAGLHAAPCGEAADSVARNAVAQRVAERVRAVGVIAREVEEVHAGEDDEEAAEERDGVYGGGGVEALEEEAGGDEGKGREGYVVEGIDAAGC